MLSCISFDSYIKPQLCSMLHFITIVVYLLIPTSNHNTYGFTRINGKVVYLLIPTSNHNKNALVVQQNQVVYLLIPTSNHNL